MKSKDWSYSKERLKNLVNSHILTLATPIPRTLHMALSGIRDLSIVASSASRKITSKIICYTI